MNKRSLQNSGNLLCNWYTMFYEKEGEDWKKAQGSFLERWLINVAACVYQQFIRGQILQVGCTYQRVLGLLVRKHALCARALLSLFPLLPPASQLCMVWEQWPKGAIQGSLKTKHEMLQPWASRDSAVFCAASLSPSSCWSQGNWEKRLGAKLSGCWNLLTASAVLTNVSWGEGQPTFP